VTTVVGIQALERRLKAIGDTKAQLRAMQIATVSEAQALVPRKSGHLQRSIRPGRVADDFAIVEARTPYARYVEEGTGLYGPKKKRIVPKTKKAMRWKGSGVRLSGRSRSGAEGTGWAFATSIKGRRKTPYLIPGAKAAMRKAGLKDAIVTRWNRAA
jgi:hypothetical protein